MLCVDETGCSLLTLLGPIVAELAGSSSCQVPLGNILHKQFDSFLYIYIYFPLPPLKDIPDDSISSLTQCSPERRIENYDVLFCFSECLYNEPPVCSASDSFMYFLCCFFLGNCWQIWPPRAAWADGTRPQMSDTTQTH